MFEQSKNQNNTLNTIKRDEPIKTQKKQTQKLLQKLRQTSSFTTTTKTTTNKTMIDN